MISAGFFKVYAELGPAFEKSTGHKLVTTRGPSLGDSPEAIPTRLARGEQADVLIMDWARRRHPRDARPDPPRQPDAGSPSRSSAWWCERASPSPTSARSRRLRKTLLAAKSIAYSDSSSGTYLSTVGFKKLGVADEIAGRTRKVRGPPSGEPVAAVVARGEAEIGFQQVSELINVPGADFVGTVPAEIQPPTFFVGALPKGSQQPDAAVALLRFLSSAEAAAVITKAGLKPLAAR